MINCLNIGSIVEIKNEIKKIMIIGKDENAKFIGVAFPIGYVNKDENIIFSGEDIIKVYSIGYQEGV